MKLTKLLYILSMLLLVMCKKNDAVLPEGTITAKEIVYNNAIRKFQPDEQVGGNLSTNINISTLYYYLQRQGKQDTLLQIDFPANAPSDYAFAVKPENWAGVDLRTVKGLKLLAVRDNSTTLEKTVAIKYFDPDAPEITGVPETLTPQLTGTTAVSGKVTSPTGISKIRFLDNSTGDFTPVDSIAGNGTKDLPISYQYAYREGAGQLKIEAIDIYGLKAEIVVQFVNIPYKPVITFASATLKLALPDGKPEVNGSITSFTALSNVKAYIVRTGGNTLHQTVTPVLVSSSANEFKYTFSVTGFPFAADVTGCRIEATDAAATNASTAPVEIMPYYCWKNLTMMAQGTATTNSVSSFFTGDPAHPVIGTCDANANPALHTQILFAMFCNSTPLLAFQNPTAITGSTLPIFKCDGASWNPPLPNDKTLMKTTFRVLNASQDALVRPRLEAMSMNDLSDSFFDGISAPTSNAPNSGTYGVNSLIYAKTITQTGVSKNILMRITNVNVVATPNQGTSTISFDILKEK